MTDCGVKVEGCDLPATHRVDIDGSGSDDPALIDSIERYACSHHIRWYRREFGDRGYGVSVEKLETA